MDLSVLRSQLRDGGYSKAETKEVIAAVKGKGKGKGKKGKGKDTGKGGDPHDAKGKTKGKTKGKKGKWGRSAVAVGRGYG